MTEIRRMRETKIRERNEWSKIRREREREKEGAGNVIKRENREGKKIPENRRGEACI